MMTTHESIIDEKDVEHFGSIGLTPPIWEDEWYRFKSPKERIEERKVPCLHDNCPDCKGRGKKEDGTLCIHMISCPCPKCTPR